MGIFSVFVNVIAPVFALVAIGYLVGPRLGLEPRTLTRYAYYLLVPAFVFNVMSTAQIEVGLAARMLLYMLAVVVASGLLGYGVARIMRRPPATAGAFVLIAVFGNVGNFGLPLVEFRFGPEALAPATFYFLVISMAAFAIGVAAANWVKGGSLTAALAVAKTPALLALPPALLVNWLDLAPPLALTRAIALLAAAMVPTMLITLGVQLSAAREIKLDRDVLAASAVKLLGAPALALFLIRPFGLEGLARSTGIVQAAMPAAVLTSIIALEYDLLPDFVTTTVLFSTLASVVTLTVLLAVF
ncbi:MAG: AEC family transporter [Caldilineales bacterium]|nr:AEC family transporter [Caldilineales bacterium]